MSRLRFKGKRMHDDKDSRQRGRKVLLILLTALVLMSLAATIVEASVKDSFKNAWGKMKVYVAKAAFWVNAVVVFFGLYILFILLLSEKVGSDTAKQVMMYILIGVVALIISTKFVDNSGTPEYIWKNVKFRDFTQFLIGPTTPLPACNTAQTPSFWKSMSGDTPNVPCCGTGAYKQVVTGKEYCKQALLRTNVQGAGLPAFLIASILFYLLFGGYGDKLGFKNMGGKAGEWFPIILSVLLGGLMANERVSKNDVIMIGGWIAMALLGHSLNKSLSSDKDEKGTKKFLGYGLAYAFVELLANMLGSSLWGGKVDSSQITAPRILKNIGIGLLVGFGFSILNMGKGTFAKLKENLGKAKEDDIKKDIDEGKYGRAVGRSIPGLGWLWRRKKAEAKKKEHSELLDRMDKLQRQVEAEWSKDAPNPIRINSLNHEIHNLQDLLNSLQSGGALPSAPIPTPTGAAPATPATPTATPGPPAAPPI
jgi:hypothetical protein